MDFRVIFYEWLIQKTLYYGCGMQCCTNSNALTSGMGHISVNKLIICMGIVFVQGRRNISLEFSVYIHKMIIEIGILGLNQSNYN